MARKLFVGGIPWRTTEDSLKELFSQSGEVEELAIILDRETGRSRGFGFVTMSSEEEAQKAIEAVNGQEFEGRMLTVKEAMNNNRDRGSFNRG